MVTILRIALLFLILFVLSCDVKRQVWKIDYLCKIIDAYKNDNPLNHDLGDATFEECLESRAVVLSEKRNRETMFSGKVVSYHFIGDTEKVKIYVEKYTSNNSICGTLQMIYMDNVFERTFYTPDEKAYLSFTTLKDC